MSNLFKEAIDHCRWKNILQNEILQKPEFQETRLTDYSNKSFDEIITHVHNACDEIRGIGMLCVYDITAAICRHNNITIDKVYIIGKGPKRAVRLLGLKPKLHKIEDLNIHYVEISDLVKAFDEKKYEMDPEVRNSRDGDIHETYICNWQKTQK